MEQEPELIPENSEQEICVEPEPIQIGGSGGSVYSVNGKVGYVILTTSDLPNTSDYQTTTDVASSIASATSIIDARLDAVDASIDAFTDLVPSQASASNQLADKAFVNSSISTNTANFVGTFNTIEELEAVANPTNNDYGFVIDTDVAGNVVYNRYKYIASTSAWTFEYALNNSSFTAAQWAAIQSGITAALVSKITTNEDAIAALRTALLGKQDTLTPGTNVQIENNVISATDTVYALPPATDSTLGGVKVGDGLSVEADGTLSAEGGAYTVLTTAGYASDNYIHAWELDDGMYKCGEDLNIKFATSGATRAYNAGTSFIVITANNKSRVFISREFTGTLNVLKYRGVSSSGSLVVNTELLAENRVVTNLTTDGDNYILAASQGKALNDKIGDLSTLDTADQSSVVAAINEVVGSGGGSGDAVTVAQLKALETRVAALEGN